MVASSQTEFDATAFEVVRLLSSVRTPPQRLEEARTLIQEGLGWNSVLLYAGYHGVQAAIYANLKRMDVGIPEDVLSFFKSWVNSRTASSLFLFQELGRLNEMFSEVGIRTVAVKGPVLAQHIYGSLALRPYVDLDLIVEPGAFRKAEEVLKADGFQSKTLPPHQLQLYLWVHRQFTFWKYRDRSNFRSLSVVDLHTSLMPPGYTDRIGFDVMWSRSERLPVMHREVPMPGAEDLVRVLAFHGFKNRWDRLKYVIDLSETVRKVGDLNWDDVLRSAQDYHWRGVLALGLQVCDRVAPLNLPPEVSIAAEDRTVRGIAAAIVDRFPLQAHIATETFQERMRLNLTAQDRLSGRVRYSAYVLARRLSEFILPDSEPD